MQDYTIWDYVEYVLVGGDISKIEKAREAKLEDVFKYLYFKVNEIKGLEENG